MKKIKVLHIITRLDMGGSSSNTIETVARLDRSKYQVILVSGRTHDPDNEIHKLLRRKRVPCIFIDELRRELHPWYDLRAFTKLFLLLKRGNFDLVHTHSSKGGILGRWAAWATKTKYIIHTPHGHVFYGYFGKFITKMFIYAEKITTLITDKVITLTQKGKEDHIKFGIAKADKFVPIYSGIDLAQFNGIESGSIAKRCEYNIPQDALVVGTVARLDPIKGNRFLIEAMAQVVQKFPDVRLLLVGDGEERDLLEKRVNELDIEQNIIFTGFRQNVSELLHIIDVFVLASLNEGMGRVILEAMASRKAVIATKTGGIPELVHEGESGLLVPPGDVDSLAQAIIELLSDRQRAQEFGSNGLKMVGEVFSLDKMVENIDMLYQNIIGQSS